MRVVVKCWEREGVGERQVEMHGLARALQAAAAAAGLFQGEDMAQVGVEGAGGGR